MFLCQNTPVYQFWRKSASDPLRTRWEPGGPGWDQSYDVARVKLRPYTNFGGIWLLTRWEPGGTRRTGSEPGLCYAHGQTVPVCQIWRQSAWRFGHHAGQMRKGQKHQHHHLHHPCKSKCRGAFAATLQRT